MSKEVSNEPRKIGKHFKFEGFKIGEVNGRVIASVLYEYNGRHMKERSMDQSYYLEDVLIEKILEPLNNKNYKSKDAHRLSPERKYNVTKNGSEFSIGHTIESHDRIKVVSLDGSPMENFRSFLKDLEESMVNYRED